MSQYIPESELASLAEIALGKLSQKEAAEMVGILQPRISEAVAGRRHSAAIELIKRLYALSEEASPTIEVHYLFPSELMQWLERQQRAANAEVEAMDITEYPIDPRKGNDYIGRKGFYCEHESTDRFGIPHEIDLAGDTV